MDFLSIYCLVYMLFIPLLFDRMGLLLVLLTCPSAPSKGVSSPGPPRVSHHLRFPNALQSCSLSSICHAFSRPLSGFGWGVIWVIPSHLCPNISSSGSISGTPDELVWSPSYPSMILGWWASAFGWWSGPRGPMDRRLLGASTWLSWSLASALPDLSQICSGPSSPCLSVCPLCYPTCSRIPCVSSASLNKAERNYDIWDREFLRMIHGLKHNCHLLIGSPHKVIILTDHKNLAHYRHPQKINQRVARYLHILADFDLELWHIPGTTNKANTLSRRPDHDKGARDNKEIIALPDSLFAWALQISKVDKTIRKFQKKDPVTFTQWKRMYQCNKIDGILYKDEALVVTTRGPARRDLLRHYHDGVTAGHPGVWKTLQSLRKDYWWPNMQLYIQWYIGGCATCQQNKTITHRNTPPLQPIAPKEGAAPFTTIAMDFVVKLPESKGSNSILTIMDQGCTKAVILLPCKETMRSKEIVELFKDRAFPYIGIPSKVISDRNPHFMSSLFWELCKGMGIKQNLSTAYHPQTDGQLEQTNQSMEDLLRIFCNYQ